MHPGIFSKRYPSERWSWCIKKLVLIESKIILIQIGSFKAVRVDCNNRVFSSVTTMQLIYQTNVPVLSEAMMAIELQLIGLTFVVPLYHCSGVVDVSCVLMPGIFHKNYG